jgi:hypothetical protein
MATEPLSLRALTRRDLLRLAGAAAAVLALPPPRGLSARSARGPDQERLDAWTGALQSGGLIRRDAPIGRAAIRVGELAAGTPYQAGTLDAYVFAARARPPGYEPLTLSLTQFDCVTLVESCLAVPRAARDSAASWERFGHEIERMRYRGGVRRGYASRLHYFSEWIADGARRGLVRDLGAELGGAEDARPLRFMTAHRAKYPALGDDGVFREVEAMERRLDGHSRRVIPTKRIPEVVGRIETGDVLAFATEIAGLDVTHSAFAYRDEAGVLRVLHAPLSGGVVEVTRTTLPEYVAAIRRATGILVARPLWAI